MIVGLVVKEAYFRCIIPGENRDAFYELRLVRDRNGFALHRRWGRIGTKGQRATPENFIDLEAARQGFERIKRIRLHHRYQLVQEWPKEMSKPLARIEPVQIRLPLAV